MRTSALTPTRTQPAAPVVAPAGPTNREDLAADLRLAVARLSRRLRQHAVGGLSPSQVSALATLDNHGPMPMGGLARHEAVTAPTVTRIVDRLVAQELVARRVDPADGRSTVVEITTAGRRSVARLRRERTAFLAERLAAVDDRDAALLAAALPVLRRLAEENE